MKGWENDCNYYSVPVLIGCRITGGGKPLNNHNVVLDSSHRVCVPQCALLECGGCEQCGCLEQRHPVRGRVEGMELSGLKTLASLVRLAKTAATA